MEYFSLSQKAPWEYILSHPEGFGGQKWDISELSEKAPWEYILSHPEGFGGKKWNISFI